MRIATSQMYDRSSSLMGALTAKSDSVQNQIASTKKFTAPSDAPTAYLQLTGLKRADANGTAYGANIKTAQNTLSATDTALGSIETQLQRVQEIAIQAGNGTLSDANRAAFAAELDTIAQSLFGLANSTDAGGQSLFSGASDGAAYVRGEDGTITYAGSGEAAAIPVGEGDSVQPGISGERAFTSNGGDMFAVVAALSAALKDGGDVAGAANVAMSNTETTLDNVATARASVGARAARMDIAAETLTSTAENREASRSALEDTDISAAVVELQKTLTVLQATQASFTKLSALSLFDYIR